MHHASDTDVSVVAKIKPFSSFEGEVPVMEHVFRTEPHWKPGLEVRQTAKTQISDRGLIGLGIFRREGRY